MTPDLTRVLTAIKEAEAKATKGPWYQFGPLSEYEACRVGGEEARLVTEHGEQVALDMAERDIQFAALSRNILPHLVALVEKQAEEIEYLRGNRGIFHECFGVSCERCSTTIATDSALSALVAKWKEQGNG